MPGLLTRACDTCIGVARTVVGRPTAAAEAKVPFRHAFTRLYTTIFATAAILDAKYKDDRRKHLDEQIAEAKDAVARLQLQNAAAEVPPSAAERVPHEEGSYGGPMTLEPADTQPSLIASVDGRKAPLSRIFDHYGGEHWAIFNGTNTRRTLQALKRSDYRMLEQLLEESMNLEESPVPGRGLDGWAFNIEQLVDYLLRMHAELSARQSQPSTSSPLREAIDRLKSAGYPNIKLPNYGPMSTGEFPARLSKRMARDIGATATDPVGIIERICYNLLTSQHPLTLHTYNTLIVQLTKAGYHKIAQCIVKCHFAHFRRHHPLTEAIILNHDKEFFNYAAAHRNISVILKNSSLYFSRGGEYVLDSMVRALAGFRDTKIAVDVFCYGLSKGQVIGPQGLFQLIARCIWKLDRTLALKLVRAFTDYPEQFERMLTAEPAAQSILLHQMGYLLDIANLWRHPAILRPRLEAHDIDPRRFHRFRMTITKCNLERQVDQIARVTRRLVRAVAGVGAPKRNGMSRTGAMERVSPKASGTAYDFDFHMEAANPRSWVRKDFRVLASAKSQRPPRRVWTARDYERARANLRVAALFKEAADGGRELTDYPLELEAIDPTGVLPQGWLRAHLDAGSIKREPAAAAASG